MLLTTLIVLLLLALVLYNWYLILHSTRAPFIGPCFPLVYCLPSVFLHTRINFWKPLSDASIALGHSAISFYVPFMQRVWVILSDPRDTAAILADKFVDFPKGDYVTNRLEVFFGRGIFAADGERWSHLRKSASHLFKVVELKHMAEVFRQHGESLLQQFRNEQGQAIDVQRILAQFTLDSFVDIAYGLELSDPDFSQAFNDGQLLQASRLLFPFHEFLGSLWPPERKIARVMSKLHSTTSKLLAEYRKNPNPSETRRLSLLGRLAEEEGVTDTEIQENILNFLVAGRDTTAATLSFAVYHVFQNREVERKILEEIEQVLGDEPVTWENHTQLKYCKAVIDEVLRLCPPVPMDPKTCAVDTVLPSGLQVKKGQVVAWSAFLMGHSDKYFEAPEEFRPERFIDEEKFNGGKPIGNSNFPFQFGPRLCLGMRMAYLETIATLVLLIRTFTFDIPKQQLILPPSVTFFSSSGVLAVPRLRK